MTPPEPIRRLRVGAAHAALLPRAAYEAAFVSETPSAGFAFDRQTGRHALGSDRVIDFERPAHSLAFTPAGCDIYSNSKSGGEYLTVGWSGPAVADALYTGREDASAFDAARALRHMLLSAEPVDPLALQSAALSLFERAAGPPMDAPVDARRLTPMRRRRFEEAVEAGLSDRLTLEDLARATEMSPSRLSRAVKAVFGASPFDYVLERRVALARRLLRDPRTRLIDVALAAGFCGHAHMCRVFRRRLGASPGAFRPERRAEM